MPTDRSAFGAFLRSRRDGITPDRAGITPFPGPRRVPGLRKEELAVLAGLSVDHYSRLEQGRQAVIGHDVVEALARALRLDDTDRAHLRHLAAPTSTTRADPWEREQRPDPGLLRVMACLDGVPLLLLGRRAQVLAANVLLRAVLGVDLDPGSSFVRWLLLDPRARERIVNWTDFAEASVGSLRYESGRHPGDLVLRRLVADLRAADPQIAAWWDDHGVSDRTSVRKEIDHPVAGGLRFGIETLSTPHDATQRLVVYTVEPDSDTARALPLLASWATDGMPSRT